MSGGGAEFCYHLFYGLRANPFNVTPDPHYLYLTEASRKALAALRYGVEARKGFVVVLGEVGTGKTTLLRALLASLDPAVRPVLVVHPRTTFVQLLEYVSTELGLPVTSRTKLGMLRTLQAYLVEQLARGNTVALLIDEAQDIDISILEDLRLLSNLETDTDKVVQLVLCGQPELEKKLQDSRLRQLRQRVAVTVRLRGLDSCEVGAYIARRLERAGSGGRRIFRRGAVRAVARLSRGNPRQINLICDHALRLGAIRGHRRVGRSLVAEGHGLLLPEPAPPLTALTVRWARQALRGAALLVLAAGAGAALALMSGEMARLTSAGLGWAGASGTPGAVVPAALPVARHGSEGKLAKPKNLTPDEPEPGRPHGKARQQQASTARRPGRLSSATHQRSKTVGERERTPGPAMPQPAEIASQPAGDGNQGGGRGREPDGGRSEHDRKDRTRGPATPASAAGGEEGLFRGPTGVNNSNLGPDDALALLERFRRSVEQRDLSSLAGLLAPEVVEDGSGGRAEVLRRYATMFARPQRLAYTLHPILVQQVGNRIFVRTRVRLDVGDSRGPVRTMSWWLERTDGRLRISRLSYEPAAPEAALGATARRESAGRPTASDRARPAAADQAH